MSTDDRTPAPPAVAYGYVADALPADYWTCAPPAVGVTVTARHRSDGIDTEWAMSDTLANHVVPTLRKIFGLTVRCDPYTERSTAA